MSSTVVNHRYKPFVPFERFHARTKRFALMVCSRRAGKTVAVVNDMVARAMATHKHSKRPFYGYIAPTFNQAKGVAWQYLLEAVADIPGVKVMESIPSVRLPNGATIRIFGADNPDALRGLYFDGVVLDEYGDMKETMWKLVIRPALSDRKGWVVFIGTPKGKNAFWDMRQRAAVSESHRWFYMELKSSDIVRNGSATTGWGVLTQDELDDARIDMDSDEFAQEYECSFEAANKGSFYGKQMQQLALRRPCPFRQVPLDMSEKVSISLDIGKRDATAIWFWQVINGEVRFIDYWEETGWDAEEVVEMLGNKPYSYETMWLPHDALHQTFASRKSPLDTFRSFGAPARIVPKLEKRDGIDAVRKTLRTYELAFDSERCERGLESLRNYARKWDNDRKVMSTDAIHDEWSHGADAFRYACLVINPTTIERSQERARAKSAIAHQQARTNPFGSVNTGHRGHIYTLGDALRDYDKKQRASRAQGEQRV